MTIDWTAVVLALTVATALGGRTWIARAIANQITSDITAKLEPKWKADDDSLRRGFAEIVQASVSEIVQAKLDNGSGLRCTVDALRAEMADRFAGMDIRLDNMERQLENVITEELPIITALAERVLEATERDVTDDHD